MRQLEFTGKMTMLVAEWNQEYKMSRNTSEEPENWPDNREEEDWLSDFYVWLQCKGYVL